MGKRVVGVLVTLFSAYFRNRDRDCRAVLDDCDGDSEILLSVFLDKRKEYERVKERCSELHDLGCTIWVQSEVSVLGGVGWDGISMV